MVALFMVDLGFSPFKVIDIIFFIVYPILI